MTELIPTRWSLDDLLAEPVETSLEAALAELEAKTAAFEGYRERLTDDISAAEFAEVFQRYEAITSLSYRIGGHANLAFAADTQSQAARNLRDRADKALTEIGNRTLFFTLWLKDTSAETAARIAPAGSESHYYVESTRKFKPYTLSESEEQIINLKDSDGIEAMVGLYDMITNAFSFNLTIDGEVKQLNRSQLGVYYRHPSAEMRAAAFQELFRVYGEHSDVLSQIYNHRVRDWHSESIHLRNYTSPIAVRNLANDIPDDVVETMLAVCERNNVVYQRYFKLKAKWLGVEKLTRYDIYAPLSATDKTYDYDYAVRLVMDTFNEFSPRMGDLAQRVFDANHIDSEIRKGKRGGAFCHSGVPSIVPFVLVNYTGTANDVGTIAHELGHAIHSQMAAHHSILTFHPSLPLAETASVFSEMMLTDRLLREEADPAVRRDILAGAVDDAYATVQRQAYIALFERRAHQMINDGATADAICDAYMAAQEQQFGDSLVLKDDFKWEWITIPHSYHVPFYTYAYSFGQLLVLSLYQQYRAEGPSFIPRYLKLLSYGGSEEPVSVLREAGIEPADPAFWQGGYDVLSGMVDELESLA